MKKKSFIKAVAGAGIVAGMLSCSVTAYATTVDDVARVARELGYPEDLIQQGYNQYYADPGKYTSADFDYAIASLYESDPMTTAPQNPKPVTATTTTVAVTGSTENTNTTVPAGNGNTSDGRTDNNSNGNTNNNSGGITLRTDDGSEFTRIPENDFIKLSYDEKMNYIRNFTPEQQQVIINNLTPEERRSLLKQLPVEQKMDVVDSMKNFAETFDLNVSVDDISEDNISLSMRNNDGELVGMANAGTLVEDTGYDRKGILALSAGLIAVAGMLLAVVSRYFRTGDEK